MGGTSGIGLAAAEAFARSGAMVTVCGLANGETPDLKKNLLAWGSHEAAFVELDVRDDSAIKNALDDVVRRCGRIDVAMNNAGIASAVAPIDELELEEFDRLIAINLRGVWSGLRHQIAHMKATGGAIINTSSTAGFRTISHLSAYSATKHAILGLTKGAAQEQASNGIRVNAIAPGPVDTGLLSRMSDGHIPLNELAALVPQGRISTPAEIADVILWLASDAASFVTGETIIVDGGLTLR